MNKRLELLTRLVDSGSADSFTRYALALEYRKERQPAAAIEVFEQLRQLDAAYLPMYLMAGQVLIELERPDDARQWLQAGIELAQALGDPKALGELRSELEQLQVHPAPPSLSS